MNKYKIIINLECFDVGKMKEYDLKIISLKCREFLRNVLINKFQKCRVSFQTLISF